MNNKREIIISDIHFGHVFTPVKVLLDMNVRAKSTYRAAMEGLDLSMNGILSGLGYDPNEDVNSAQLYRQPTNVRLDDAQKRLAAFEANKEVGLCDFVKQARNIMYDFLQAIKLGHIHSIHMDNSGLFHIEISCMLHESGLESNTSTKAKFADQLKRLSDMGLEVESAKGFGHYKFNDTDNNRAVIRDILASRGASLIKICSRRDDIDLVSFALNPTDLAKFTEAQVDYTLPVTDELNDDEMIKLKKLMSEIPSSLSFIKESPDMLQTCGYVAESSFAEICDIVGFDGIVSKRVRERHAKERAANMNIHEIEKEIGNKFPAEIARGIMEKISATVAYFCVENLHGTARNLMIDEWGTIRTDIKINQRSSDLRYTYYFDDTKYNEPNIPDWELIESVFEVVKNRNDGIRLMDTENNRKTIMKFVKDIMGFEVDSISIVRDDCYVTKTRYGEAVTNLENIFVIDQISVSVDHIDGILRQHDICRMVKKT